MQEYLALSTNAKGQVLENNIERMLNDGKTFVFGEFLSLPQVQSLGATNKHLCTLNLFAFESYIDYKKNKAGYLDLKEGMVKKLKLISIADMSARRREALQRKSLSH
jgi:hypothetical protein